jgi:CheY-like chemotaxis protein
MDMAENGQQAYDMAVVGNYDLIFMDIHMPVMDGVTVTSMLIEHEKKKNLFHTPIIALTANVVEENRTAYTNAGMDAFLAKPIVLPELTELLRKYLPEEAMELVASSATTIDQENSEIALQRLADDIEIHDTALLKIIMNEFFTQAISQIDEMRTLIADRDFENATKQSLNMRSASLNLRFEDISGILTSFDSDCAARNAKKALKKLDELALEIKRGKNLYAVSWRLTNE